MITGGAVLAASRELADLLRGKAAVSFGCDPAQVVIAGGVARIGDRSVPLGELAAGHSDSIAGVLRVHREASVETPVVPMTHEDSGMGNLSPAYSFAAHGVEVEVDRETGAVTVLRVVAAHDAGTIVNPIGAEGQVVGGVVMGLGAALSEQLLYLDGRPLVTSYSDYPMLRMTEAPPIEVVFVGKASPRGPRGAKSISEVALMPIAAALANAVAHATGIRVRSLPITPDKIIGANATQSGPRVAKLWRRPHRWWSSAVRRAYPAGLHAALDRWGPRREGGSFAPNARRPTRIEKHVFPATSREAVAALLEERSAQPAGGATDLLVAREQGLCSPRKIVALSSCSDLRGCEAAADGTLVIGAATTLREAAQAIRAFGQAGDLALAHTIDAIATPQIREMGTVAGNLCQEKRCWFYRNGFDCFKRAGPGRPCYAIVGDHRYFHAVQGAGRCQATTPSDLATALTALDATIIIEGGGGQRRVAVDDFYRGPGEPALAEGEIVHSIRIPNAARKAAVSFRKLALSSDGFAIVSACTRLSRDTEGRIADCRIVLGGVANTPFRARRSEALVLNRFRHDVAVTAAAASWAVDAHPLANNGWKIEAASGVLRQSLTTALGKLYTTAD